MIENSYGKQRTLLVYALMVVPFKDALAQNAPNKTAKIAAVITTQAVHLFNGSALCRKWEGHLPKRFGGQTWNGRSQYARNQISSCAHYKTVFLPLIMQLVGKVRSARGKISDYLPIIADIADKVTIPNSQPSVSDSELQPTTRIL